jgi:RNA polymerase sigma factor (TIGR02999 family)
MEDARHPPASPAAVQDLFTQVYDELRRVAANALRQERSDHTLQPTALVHEAFLRLAKADSLAVLSRAHVFALAAQAMRRILVDHARTHRAQKRGNGLRIPIDDIDAPTPAPNVDLLALDRALEALAAIDARQAQIVELRFFGGLTVEEAAEVIGMSPRTVKREWQMSRAWLKREMARLDDAP